MARRLLLLILAVWAASSAALYVLPHGDKPARADAVVVLAGASQRLPVGVRLVQHGTAPLLVVSRSTDPGTYERRVCSGDVRVRVLCQRAQPYSTQGEARMIARLARARKWRVVDVVTSRFHVFRARFLVERCYHGELRVVAAPNPSGVTLIKDLALESVKVVYHELRRGC